MTTPFLLKLDDELSSLPLAVAAGLGCSRPVVIRDRATGSYVHGRCYARTFRECASCARLVWGDRRAQLLEGLSAATGRVAFLTLTGPSFGAVHRAGGERTEAAKLLQPGVPASSCSCGQRHSKSSALAGCPIDPTTYGYRPSVDFNSRVGVLWTRTLSELRRGLVGRQGQDLPTARVVEFQARGVAHVHAIVLLGDLDVASADIRDICSGVSVRDDAGRRSRWGKQTDVALLSTVRPQWMREQRIVTSYLAKTAGYIVKDRFIPDARLDQPVEDVQARSAFEKRLASAARQIPGLSRRGRGSYGLTAQIFRASNSWPALTLAERRRERASYGRAQAEVEGLIPAEVQWLETALPRYRFEGRPDLRTVADVLRFRADVRP